MSALLALVLVTVAAQAEARGFDVVGWYVGTNTTAWPLEKLDWDTYTSIRAGSIRVSNEGVASCPTDAFFTQLIEEARRHDRQVTLSPGLDAWQCYSNASQQQFCSTFVRTVGEAVRSCGAGVAGLEFDYEGTPTPLGKGGIVSQKEAHYFTDLMDRIQKSMGGNYTVSEDIGVWGLEGIIHRGDTYPFNIATPWVDAEIMKANPNLFVNTMSYHMPKDCSIEGWKIDAFVTSTLWGIPKAQINIGIGYYTFNSTWFKSYGEPTWHTLSTLCPNIPEDVCECRGIPFVSKKMNFEIGQLIAKDGFRGAFPWAANYDSFENNNSLVSYLAKGLSSPS